MVSVMASMFHSQQKEIRSLKQKQELVDLKNIMLQQLGKSEVCTWQLKDKIIDLSTAPTESSPSPTIINLGELRQGPNSTSALIAKTNERLPQSQTGLRVEQVSFRNIYATGNTDEYSGVFDISFASSSLAYSLKSVQTQQIFKVVGTDPATAKRIESCGKSINTLTTGEEDLDSIDPFDLHCEYRWVTSNGYGGPATFKALLVTADRLWWRERDYSSTMIYRTNKKVAVGQYGGEITNIYRVCP